MKLKDPLNLSQSDFARLSNVSKQSVAEAAQKGKLQKIDKLYSLKSQVNIHYLISHGCDIEKYILSATQAMEAMSEPVKKKTTKKKAKERQIESGGAVRKKSSQPLINTLNPDDFKMKPGEGGTDTGISKKFLLEIKLLEEQIRKAWITNERALNNLIELSVVTAVLEACGQSVQKNFVDFSRRHSNYIANKICHPECEKDIENILSDRIAVSIRAFKTEVISLMDSEILQSLDDDEEENIEHEEDFENEED